MKRLVINVDVMDFNSGTEHNKVIDVEYDGKLDLQLLINQIAAAAQVYLEDQEGPEHKTVCETIPATSITKLVIS